MRICFFLADLPQAQHAETQMHVNYLVTLKQDGSLWLEDEPIAEQALLERAKQEYKRNPRFAVVVRADQNIDYGLVVALLDKLRRRWQLLIVIDLPQRAIVMGTLCVAQSDKPYNSVCSEHRASRRMFFAWRINN